MSYESMNSSACHRATTILHDIYNCYTLTIGSCQEQHMYHTVNYNGFMIWIYLPNPLVTKYTTMVPQHWFIHFNHMPQLWVKSANQAQFGCDTVSQTGRSDKVTLTRSLWQSHSDQLTLTRSLWQGCSGGLFWQVALTITSYSSTSTVPISYGRH